MHNISALTYFKTSLAAS